MEKNDLAANVGSIPLAAVLLQQVRRQEQADELQRKADESRVQASDILKSTLHISRIQQLRKEKPLSSNDCGTKDDDNPRLFIFF